MEDKKEAQPPIIDQLKEYAETYVKLAKYRAIEGGTSVAASIIADVVVIFCMLLAFIFASITLAFFLAYLFNSDWEGFGCVALMYLIIALVVKYNRKSLERPVINAIIQKIFK
ncbi:Putative Holin-X, holin superfamily III [Mucilaginibacter mallensis]|uniref:Putative Holin-X, holin superfamily III n=1 Tax=Mucilaginibacter mallensis TaxID=652787 RepID=A0A1H2C442_MUCMA|nr:phage holin family protein [Mucilaginibacter mallensis]SDT65203.1 Putative Holin-X, holin superfamily III [Mucilaginibacter mallensis]